MQRLYEINVCRGRGRGKGGGGEGEGGSVSLGRVSVVSEMSGTRGVGDREGDK